MKEITYKERSNFYANEVKKNINDIKLLKSIKYKYSISSVIICPCASGVYLNECSKIFKKSYFIDIEKSMIDIVNDNILTNKVDNIKACTHNMVNLKDLKIKYDCIISLNQGIQYLNYSEFEEFLNNNYLVTDYIVLDLFNFNLDGMLPYYNSNIKDGEFYFSKSFMIKNKNIKRYNKHIHNNYYIDFYYKYFDERSLLFETNFRLYNYEYKLIKEIIEKNNKFQIQEKIDKNDGTYILVLKTTKK